MRKVVHPSGSRRAWVPNSRAMSLAIYAAGALGLHNCLYNGSYNEDAPQAPYEVVERLSVVKNMPVSALAWQLKMQGGDRDESGNHESHDPAFKALPDSTADSGDRGSTSSKGGRPIPENALPLSGDCLYEALPVASGKLDTTFPVPPENPDLAFADEFRTDRLCGDTNIDNSGGVSQGPTAATGSGDQNQSVQEQGGRTDSSPQGLRHQNVNVDLCQNVDFFSRTVQEPKMLHLMHSPVKIQSPRETASLEGRHESREEEPQKEEPEQEEAQQEDPHQEDSEPQIEEAQQEEAAGSLVGSQKEEPPIEETQKEETQEEESQKEESPGSLVGSEQACMQEDTRCHETELNKAADGKKRHKLECDVCGKRFDRISHLTVHMRKHTGEKPFECNFAGCNKSFTTHSDLVVHVRRHRGEKPFKCDFRGCNESFVTNHDVTRHKRRHAREKPYKCDVKGCNKSFARSDGLTRHRRIHTGEKQKMRGPTGTQSRRETPLKARHVSREEEAKAVEAEKEEAQKEEAQKEEACTQQDGTEFVHETELSKAADDTKRHKCNVCGRKFTRKYALTCHMMTHTGGKPHKCTFEGCDKRYAQNSELKKHIRTHTGEKPYLCDFAGCGKSFVNISQMMDHKRRHTGEKPFKCTWPDCNMTFAAKSDLANHQWTHTGRKPHKCTVAGCAWSFAKKSDLKRHMKRHK